MTYEEAEEYALRARIAGFGMVDANMVLSLLDGTAEDFEKLREIGAVRIGIDPGMPGETDYSVTYLGPILGEADEE